MFLLHSGPYLAHRNIKERWVIQYLVEDVLGKAFNCKQIKDNVLKCKIIPSALFMSRSS